MDKAKKTLDDIQTKAKRLWDENPLVCIVVGIAAANAGSKLMRANSDRRNSKAWTREVKRRERNDKLNK
jgi:hypothetical protein